ncbi:MAG: cupin domain-containing protein [Pseudoxanthomonas sp.]
MSARAAGAALMGVALVLTASAAPGKGQARLSPSEIAGLGKGGAGPGTSGIAGIRTTVLFGDPARSGPYTIEIRVPPHTRIAAHTHRDRRSAVVVSGRWYFGYGTTLAEDRLKLLPAGSFYTEPAGDAHFALTRDEPAVVYISGDGPTDTHFTQVR